MCGSSDAYTVVDQVDGTFTVVKIVDGNYITETFLGTEFTDSTELTDRLNNFQDKLNFSRDLLADGVAAPLSEEITRLHEIENLGFGVIVKLLWMAKEAAEACVPDSAVTTPDENLSSNEVNLCNVTLAGLVEEFKGEGMGKLFQKYDKPGKVGVGHIRNDKESQGKGPKDKDNGNSDPETTVEPTGHGRWQSGETWTPPGQAKKQDSGPSTSVQGKSNGKWNAGNNGKGNGKAKGKP